MYYISFIILVALLAMKNLIKSRKLQHILCLIPIILVVIMRYGVGADYFSYEYIYNFLDISSFGSMINSMNNIELGYKIIFYVARLMNISFAVTIGVVSAVMTIIVAKLISSKSKNIPLSYLLYYSCFFLPWNLNAVRQGLAIVLSLYILFGDLKMSQVSKNLLILLLASLHISVIIVIPIYYLSKIKLNKKKIVIILLTSMVFSLLPLNEILKLFENIPFLSKLYLYTSENSNLLDFQSISRLVILSPILFFYNDFKDKEMVNFSLLSFSLYFVLKNNELIASRMSIYGFFLIILLLPEIVSFTKWSKKMTISLTVVSIIFSGLFFEKEFNAAFRQANFVGNAKDRNWISIFNKDVNQRYFLNQFNLITETNQICSKNNLQFFESTDFEDEKKYSYIDGDTFKVVKFPNKKYGVINQKGNIVQKGKYTEMPVISDYILITKTVGSHFKRSIYIDLRDGMEVSYEVAQPIIMEFQEKLLKFESEWFNIRQMYYEELVNTPLNEIVPVNQFTHLSLVGFSTPMWYNVVESTVHQNSFMFFVNNKLEPLNDRIYNFVDAFDLSLMARGVTRCGVEIINQEGQVIWYEKPN